MTCTCTHNITVVSTLSLCHYSGSIQQPIMWQQFRHLHIKSNKATIRLSFNMGIITSSVHTHWRTSSTLLSVYCSQPILPSAVFPRWDTSVTPKKSPRAVPMIPAPRRRVWPDIMITASWTIINIFSGSTDLCSSPVWEGRWAHPVAEGQWC